MCIESSMRLLRQSLAFALLAIALPAVLTAGTPGSFRGIIVQAPSATHTNWIFVQGRNGMARRVDISHARVVYDESVPAANRQAKPQDALIQGAEVRVTAEQGSDGEWRASKVEILKTASGGKQDAASNDGKS